MGALITRRGLIATAAATSVIPAVSAAGGRKITTREAEFVRAIAGLHPNGLQAAVHALELGMDLASLTSIEFEGAREEVPALNFGPSGWAKRTQVTPINYFRWRA